MSQQPIVLFDSGVGGTSILKEIVERLPHEDFIYLADSKNAPYGERTPQEILDLSIKNTDFALGLDAKLIVVACNTATTNAISYLRTHYKLPFIGIEPAIKPAALHSEVKRIGVLATKGTLSSALFKQTSEVFAQGVNVVEVTGKGIVEAVEGGWTSDQHFMEHLKTQVQAFIEEDIDYLVLGCTHYPYIIPQLKQLLPEHVKIIDSGRAVAKQTEAVLEENKLRNSSLKPGKVELYTNADNVFHLKHLIKAIPNARVLRKVF
ncbi:glutamate racemase [Psychroflexus sp. YR1-1]|uniref:Glutamate racemase n=1 Tax=Psychroflexus aurantiacus TaxID=2709310 RepID=A0A6B3R2B7_9FLAO|nr:glutamate racemase [Psychroflexus aurantiacus]NEV92795.1 glutamate racemase [Psychroflexus aurantiacus]